MLVENLYPVAFWYKAECLFGIFQTFQRRWRVD
jgi:hypothetical protein